MNPPPRSRYIVTTFQPSRRNPTGRSKGHFKAFLNTPYQMLLPQKNDLITEIILQDMSHKPKVINVYNESLFETYFPALWKVADNEIILKLEKNS